MKTHFAEYRNGYRVFLTAHETVTIFNHKRKPIRVGTIAFLRRRNRLSLRYKKTRKLSPERV